MPDWTKSMQRTFEYYIVDPDTWKDTQRIDTIISSSISWDLTADTLGSASINLTNLLGECYVRFYLITLQNGIRERRSLGTFLVQTPSSTFDGKYRSIQVDAYTPLIELKENYPPLGYTILKNENIMTNAFSLTRTNLRAPVVEAISDKTLDYNYTTNQDDTWFNFIYDLITQADYSFDLDELGRILFAPKQRIEEMSPVWTFNTDNSSILTPSVTMNHDIYGIPNVIEVDYTLNGRPYTAKAINNDPMSPISTISRGREITKRITNAQFNGIPTTGMLDEYAAKALREYSKVSYKLSYSHSYCPVRIGDCVRINYPEAGLENVKARVVSQSITCDTSMTVNETAEYSVKLWG